MVKPLVILGERTIEEQTFIVITKTTLTNSRLVVRHTCSGQTVGLSCFLGNVEPYSTRRVRIPIPSEEAPSYVVYSLDHDGGSVGPFRFVCEQIDRVGVLLPCSRAGLIERIKFNRRVRAQVSSSTAVVHAKIEYLFGFEERPGRRPSSPRELKRKSFEVLFKYVKSRYAFMRRVCNVFAFRTRFVAETIEERWVGEFLQQLALNQTDVLLSQKMHSIYKPSLVFKSWNVWVVSYESLLEMWLSTLRIPSHISRVCVLCWETPSEDEIYDNLLNEPNFLSAIEPGTRVNIFFPMCDDRARFEEHILVETSHADVDVFRYVPAHEHVTSILDRRRRYQAYAKSVKRLARSRLVILT